MAMCERVFGPAVLMALLLSGAAARAEAPDWFKDARICGHWIWGAEYNDTLYSDEEQEVTQDRITTWEFDIRALKRGKQQLILSVSLRIPVRGQPKVRKSIPVREATIDVQVGTPTLVAHFVRSNWQWFITTVIAIAAVVVVVLYH